MALCLSSCLVQIPLTDDASLIHPISLKITPAMAAGVIDTLWPMNDVVALIDTKEALRDRSRGKYK